MIALWISGDVKNRQIQGAQKYGELKMDERLGAKVGRLVGILYVCKAFRHCAEQNPTT